MSPPLRDDPKYSINVSDVVVSREDEREIERLYPFKAGAQYVLPSRMAFARERLKLEDAKESRQVCMLRELAAHALPPLMRNAKIDQSTVSQVLSLYKHGLMPACVRSTRVHACALRLPLKALRPQVDEMLYHADGSFNLPRLYSALKESLANVTRRLDQDADLSDTVMEQMQQYETILAGLSRCPATKCKRVAAAHAGV